MFMIRGLKNKHKIIFLAFGLICLLLFIPDGKVSAKNIINIYDNQNRLTKVVHDDGTIFHYTYDAVGNRLTKDIEVVLETQNIQLITNWNWVSFNVLPEDTSFEAIFGANINLVYQIKTSTQSATHLPDGWIGGLTDMSDIRKGVMYKINTTNGFTLSVTGAPIPPDMPIEVSEGWTWIAYLPTSCMPVINALTSLLPDLYQVKSQTQSKTNFDGIWRGDLIYMCPGQGYMVNMNASGILIYPAP